MAINKAKKRLRGIYLVPDALMMKPHFGPSEHIKVGLAELKKNFDIELLVLGKYEDQGTSGSNSAKSPLKGIAVKNGFAGLLRDLKLLYKSNKDTGTLLKALKRDKIDFIYERGQYLDFRGVRLANKLGVRHFYEVNWLNYLGIRQFYRSWFNSTAKRMEEYAYKKSTLNFFVGTQHLLIDIPTDKVHTIQNGIHEALIEDFNDHVNQVKGKIKICYVANLMPHHRFDILIDALKASEISGRIELHLVGYNFESYKAALEGVQCVFYGPVRKDKLPEIIKGCNIGLISGGPSYSSFMKLFEYAAFKLCVVCPDLHNIKIMFSDSEILYFEADNHNSLARQLTFICSRPDLIPSYGNNICRKVKDKYTWERIYEDISNQIAIETYD